MLEQKQGTARRREMSFLLIVDVEESDVASNGEMFGSPFANSMFLKESFYHIRKIMLKLYLFRLNHFFQLNLMKNGYILRLKIYKSYQNYNTISFLSETFKKTLYQKKILYFMNRWKWQGKRRNKDEYFL